MPESIQETSKHYNDNTWTLQHSICNNGEKSYTTGNKELQFLNNTIDQQDLKTSIEVLSNNNRTHVFSSAQEIFSRTDHMLGHKTSIHKYKRAEIIQSMFSKNNEIRNEYQKESWGVQNILKLNYAFLHNQWIK